MLYSSIVIAHSAIQDRVRDPKRQLPHGWAVSSTFSPRSTLKKPISSYLMRISLFTPAGR